MYVCIYIYIYIHIFIHWFGLSGVDPIAPDGNGRTPEMWAEASGHHSTAMFLTMVL